MKEGTDENQGFFINFYKYDTYLFLIHVHKINFLDFNFLLSYFKFKINFINIFFSIQFQEQYYKFICLHYFT